MTGYISNPLPPEPEIHPRRGGEYIIEEVSIGFVDGEFRFYDDPERGHATTVLRVEFVIDAGEDDPWIEAIQWSSTTAGPWQDIPKNHRLFWAAEDFVDARKNFPDWARGNAQPKPRPMPSYFEEELRRRVAA